MTSTYEYKKTGIMITVIYVGIMIYMLLYFGFSTPLPLPAEQGIMVNFGDQLTGAGPLEPKITESRQTAPTRQEEASQKTAPEKGTLTQDYEGAPAIKAVKPKIKKEEVKLTPVTKKETTKPRTEPVKQQPEVNPLALYKSGKGTTDNTQTSEGITYGKGNQGNPSGSPDSKNYLDAASFGKGITPNLQGRSPLALPEPEYKTQVEGVVVVAITVDRDGRVTQAEPGVKGSTTLDPSLLEAAKKAALQARFNSKTDAAIYQKGTITYRFRLQ